MELAMHNNVMFFGPGSGPGGFGGPRGFGRGPMGSGPGFGGPRGFGRGPWGYGRGPHGPMGPYGRGPMIYGGNPMMFHHTFHAPAYYGFMHAPGYFYAGPMHHHGGGWSFFGPFWGYRGFAGPEFYFGRAHDPFFGPTRGPFFGAFYRGWFRGYGWHYPRTWMGGWFGIWPMGIHEGSINGDGEPNWPVRKSWLDKLADWWETV